VYYVKKTGTHNWAVDIASQSGLNSNHGYYGTLQEAEAHCSYLNGGMMPELATELLELIRSSNMTIDVQTRPTHDDLARSVIEEVTKNSNQFGHHLEGRINHLGDRVAELRKQMSVCLLAIDLVRKWERSQSSPDSPRPPANGQ